MKELGQHSKTEHVKLLDYICSLSDIHEIFLYGKQFKEIEQSYQRCYYFDDKGNMIQQIIKRQYRNHAILFKGSRSLKMEDIIEGITGSS